MMLDELQGTALTLDLQALSPLLMKRIIAKRDRFDRGLREIIQQGIDEGLFRAGDPKMIGFAIMGAVNWIDEVVRSRRSDCLGGNRHSVSRITWSAACSRAAPAPSTVVAPCPQ